MIDTIRLYAEPLSEENPNGYTVRDSSKFILQQEVNLGDGTLHEDELLFIDDESKQVSGRRAYYWHQLPNNNWISFYCKPKGGGQSRFFLKASLPKLLKKHNAFPLTKPEYEQAIDLLQSSVTELGIICNVRQMNLSRVDLATSIETKYPPDTYFELLKRLPLTRFDSRTEFYTGITIGNKSMRLTFHDKKQHIKDILGIGVSDLPDNLLRYEVQFLHAAKCRSILKRYTLQELLDSFDNLAHIHGKCFIERFRFLAHNEDDIPSLTLQHKWKRFLETISPKDPNKQDKALSQFIAWEGMYSFLRLFKADVGQLVKQFQAIIESRGLSQSSLDRLKTKSLILLSEQSIITKNNGTVRLLDLYHDIRQHLTYNPGISSLTKAELEEIMSQPLPELTPEEKEQFYLDCEADLISILESLEE